MKNITKILAVLLIIGAILIGLVGSIYTESIEVDNNTLIVSVCTGNMRALETGVSVYAGMNGVPMVLSDKTMPEQLDSWLPGYVKKNNITKIVVVGPVTPAQLFNFMKLNVQVKQVNGQNIAEILTKIAKSSDKIKRDTIIITASDPLAGELGAYMKIPVFITASNSTYQSGEYLDEQYLDYMENNQVKRAIIVGSIPDTIKNQLKDYDLEIEELSGATSIEVSNRVNNKLISEGYVNNPHTAYYGFYGELPTIIPTLVKNNAIMIEDSSNTGDILPYLLENNITTVVLTRNAESDYIQMEETDYISTDVISNLENNNITVRYLTKARTLDEATGLYDMKILTAEEMENNTNQTLEDNDNEIVRTQPPLIAMLEGTEYHDSNNISVSITKDNSEYTVKWSTIHPYTWKKISDDEYYATSNTGYDYVWKKENNIWNVQYRLNGTVYYTVTWMENPDYSWTEIQSNKVFLWKYDGTAWKCYDKDNYLIYYIAE